MAPGRLCVLVGKREGDKERGGHREEGRWVVVHSAVRGCQKWVVCWRELGGKCNNAHRHCFSLTIPNPPCPLYTHTHTHTSYLWPVTETVRVLARPVTQIQCHHTALEVFSVRAVQAVQTIVKNKRLLASWMGYRGPGAREMLDHHQLRRWRETPRLHICIRISQNNACTITTCICAIV